MDCFHDFCLACDRESDGPYCSQACKLLDLEKASAPSSPIALTGSSTFAKEGSTLASSRSGTASSYVLTPAYQFPERASGTSQSKADDYRLPKTTYFMRPSTSTTDQQRSLTPSTSRSSLSSSRSDSNPSQISEQAKLELQEYFNSFEHARASKRRQSTW